MLSWSSSVPELWQWGGDADVLTLLQPPLTVNQVVHTIYHQLHQLHLHQEHTRPDSGAPGCPHCTRGWHCHPQSPCAALAHGPGAVLVPQTHQTHVLQNLPPQKQLCPAPTSDFPSRSRLEMSKTLPVAAVSTPPVPRFCSRRFSRILGKRLSWCPEKVSVLRGATSKAVGALRLTVPGQPPAVHWTLSGGSKFHREPCPEQSQGDIWIPSPFRCSLDHTQPGGTQGRPRAGPMQSRTPAGLSAQQPGFPGSHRTSRGDTLLSSGSLMWTPARRPVPRLEGQVRM